MSESAATFYMWLKVTRLLCLVTFCHFLRNVFFLNEPLGEQIGEPSVCEPYFKISVVMLACYR